MLLKQLLTTSFGYVAVLAAHIPRSTFLNAAGATTPEYDYIVVGSGPGGGPLAARLASAGFKVLLIDAGSDQGSSLQETVPSLWPVSAQYAPMQWNYFVNHYADPKRAQQDSKYTWQTPEGDYYTGDSPPENSTALGILYPRAGTLGGCAAHNALITVYPQDDDYAYMENLTGDKSWSPRNMRLLFEKLEKNEYVGLGTSGHGRNGWFGTSVLDLSILANDSKVDALAESMYAAINNKKLGSIPKTSSDLSRIMQLDVNGPGNTAKPNFYQLPLAVDNGTRSSPRDFILQVAKAAYANGTKKYSLDVWLNTFVIKVLFDQSGATPQAIGVEYVQGDGLYGATPSSYTQIPTGAGKVLAAKEVIISAGAFNTPQLLKLSGVGPKGELDSFGIPIVVDVPGVGQNLQDRYEMGVVSSTTSSFEILNGCTLISASPDKCLQQWQSGSNNANRGFYGGNAFPLAVVFKSSVAASDPDVFVFGGPVSFSGFFPGWANVSTLLPSEAPGWWSWVILKAHTRNTAGNVTLRSLNPLDTPVINFNSFDTGTTANNADQLDLQASYEGIQLARQANANLAALVAEYGSAYSSSSQGLTPFTEVFPGAQYTGDDLKNIIKSEAFGHHASCTAAIGADDDPLAVLDTDFKVRGVRGLRVVDASSFPKTPGFFPAVPLYMMSEKAAIVIAKDQNVTISYSG